MDFEKIHCKDIAYRSGCIEVMPSVHEGHVNLETWNIHADRATSISDLVTVRDTDVVAVTEVELNPSQVLNLIQQLQRALAILEAK